MIQTQSPEKDQQNLASHSIFNKPAAPVVVKPIGLEDLIKPYALVGIISGGEPEALISNRTTKQTSYVRAGEEFDKLKVIKISAHSVLIGYQNEQKEIFIEGERK